MADVIVVFSGSGGTGKSFFACNLSYGLKSAGKNVLLVESGFNVRADDIILGIKSDSIYTFTDICSGECKPNDAVIKSAVSGHPDFISAGFGKADPEKGISALLNSLSSNYDYIIFDLSLCFDRVFQETVKQSDIAIAITDDLSISVRNTALATSKAKQLGCPEVYTVLNNVVINNDESSFVEDVIDETGAGLLGIIPTDDYVKQSIINSDPIYKYNTYAGRSLENICKRILNTPVPEYETGVSSGLFSKNKLVLK
ncbi:MAG: AAA family ATPase [Clostridia bacterium]|nr:AAA family ATPase [Clostridia bacterium]